MKKRMCLLMAFALAIGIMCQPLAAMANGVSYLYSVYACTDDGFLNMREGSTTSSEVVAEIPDCFEVEIMSVSENGNWGYGSCLLENGQYAHGWIYLPMTRRTYEAARDSAGRAYGKTVVVSSSDGSMNLRKEPAVGEYNLICAIPNDTVLHVTRKTDKGWGLVNYNGNKGWISLSGTIEYIPTPEPTPEPTPNTAPTFAPVATSEAVSPSNRAGMVSLDGGRIISSNTLVLILIGAAVFLVVAVAILMIVVLNRSKNDNSADAYMEQPPYGPQYPEPYYADNQGCDPYYDGNNPPYGEQPAEPYYADNQGYDPYYDENNQPYGEQPAEQAYSPEERIEQ